MRKILTWAVVGFAAVATVGSSAMAQSASRRQMEQDYNESLRKGEPVQQQQTESRTIIQQQTAAAVPLELYDQFPNQGTDQPDGNMGQLDYNDGEAGWQVSTNLGPGLPVTGGLQPGKLAPQQAPPHYRRGP